MLSLKVAEVATATVRHMIEKERAGATIEDGLGATAIKRRFQYKAGLSCKQEHSSLLGRGKNTMQAPECLPEVHLDSKPLFLSGEAIHLRPDVSFHQLSNDGVLFDPVRQRVFVTNEAEAVAWCLLRETASFGDAAVALARLARGSVSEAKSWLTAAAAQWSIAGLLGEMPLVSTPTPSCNHPGRWVPVAHDNLVRRRYQVLDTIIEVAFARTVDAAIADEALGGLQTDGGMPSVGCFMVHSDREGCVISMSDGRVLERIPNPKQRIPALRMVLVKLALERAVGFAAVHAAAVARSGRAILIPGHSGVGKSTLAAGCVLGGWEHVSDDTVILDSEGNLRPLPFPLCLKQGAWAALGHIGARVHMSTLHESLDGRLMRYLTAPRPAEGPCALTAIATPRWRAGAAPCLRRLGPRESFEALLPHLYPLAEKFYSATISRVIALTTRISCFSLSYDALADGVGLLERASDT